MKLSSYEMMTLLKDALSTMDAYSRQYSRAITVMHTVVFLQLALLTSDKESEKVFEQDLYNSLGFTQMSVNRATTSLLQIHLIHRERELKHPRRNILTITQEGRSLLENLKKNDVTLSS